MTRAHASDSALSDAGRWIAGAKEVLAEFRGKGEVPYAVGRAGRWAKCVALPVCCWPCGMWSFLMRVVACPGQCMCRGAGFACSNNGCTDLSDACIAAMYNEAWRRVALPPVPEAEKMTDAEKEELKAVLRETLKVLERGGTHGLYTVHHYHLMDALFKGSLGGRAHPFGAIGFIRGRLAEL